MQGRAPPTPFLPAWPAASFLLVVLMAAACKPCHMESTVVGFTPVCEQCVLRRYTTEARLAVTSDSQVLVEVTARRASVA